MLVIDRYTKQLAV